VKCSTKGVTRHPTQYRRSLGRELLEQPRAPVVDVGGAPAHDGRDEVGLRTEVVAHGGVVEAALVLTHFEDGRLT